MKDRYENLDEYIADLRAALSQNDGCANHHYNLGVALLSKGDFVAAEESFLAAVRNSSHLAEPMCSLAASVCSAAISKAACATTRKRPIAAPSSPCRGATSALCICSAASPKRPSAPLQKALKWDAEFIQAMATLGAAYYMNGQYDESIKISEKAIEKAARIRAPAEQSVPRVV